jgi:hypothetical protein
MLRTRGPCFAIFVGLLSLLGLAQLASPEWLDLSLARWVPGDPTVTLTGPSDAHSSLIVQSQTASDRQWIVIGLPVSPGQALDAVELCYQASDEGTVIRQVRLVEYLDPARGLVVHDDATALTSPTPTCYRSRVPAYTAADAVSLWVRVEFAQTDDVLVIDTVSVHIL